MSKISQTPQNNQNAPKISKMATIPPKILNDQNTLEAYKITKIPLKPLKMIKISLNLKNDQNTPNTFKMSENTLKTLK